MRYVLLIASIVATTVVVTLVMFPILVVTYARLARREERDVRAQFGTTWDAYASHTPACIPGLGGTTHEHVERRT